MAVVVVGEVLTDLFPDGSKAAGGAPANVAFHVAQAGVAARLISRIGHDGDGEFLSRHLAASGVDCMTIQCDERYPSGTAMVRSGKEGTMYDIPGPAAWDFIEADETALSAAHAARVIVFGTLAQRHPVSRGAIRNLLAVAADGGALRLADLNLRAPCFDDEVVLWTLRHADVLKVNVAELRAVSGMLGAVGTTEELFDGLLREFNLERAVLTDGANGAWIHESGETTFVPAVEKEEVDAVGAGDAFTAMLACGLACGDSLRKSAPRAAKLAAWVVASRGATPAWFPAMRRSLGD